MPAGISWGRYLKFTTASFASMFAGSTVVHWIYKPDLVRHLIYTYFFFFMTNNNITKK